MFGKKRSHLANLCCYFLLISVYVMLFITNAIRPLIGFCLSINIKWSVLWDKILFENACYWNDQAALLLSLHYKSSSSSVHITQVNNCVYKHLEHALCKSITFSDKALSMINSFSAENRFACWPNHICRLSDAALTVITHLLSSINHLFITVYSSKEHFAQTSLTLPQFIEAKESYMVIKLVYNQ